MANPDEIFLALKSVTRRKILEMLSAEPMYLTQLAENLDLGQQAIFRHLQLLENSGLLESDFRDEGQGAPRRYYQIAKAVRVEVQISPEMFDVELFDIPRIDVEPPDNFPELATIVEEYNNLIKQPHSKEKLTAFGELLKNLGTELEEISIAKSIAEATYSNIRNQIRLLSLELLPQRIDQHIIQTLTSRGGAIALKDLAVILNLSENTLLEQLKILEQKGIIQILKGTIYLI